MRDGFCRIEEIKDARDEVPGDFDNEIHKWALECNNQLPINIELDLFATREFFELFFE